MYRRPPGSTLTDTLFPVQAHFRSAVARALQAGEEARRVGGIEAVMRAVIDLHPHLASLAPEPVGVAEAGLGRRVVVGPAQREQHRRAGGRGRVVGQRPEEHTSELQSLMRNSYAVFCLKKKKI